MAQVLIEMAVIIACGSIWRMFRPSEISLDSLRLAINNLVYYLLLPALVFKVMVTAPISLDSIRIAFVAACCVIASWGLILLALKFSSVSLRDRGAVILAVMFPNATYLGLPVLEATFGEWAGVVAIQYDLFACLPLVMSLGIWIASKYGSAAQSAYSFRNFLRVPALWALLLAVIFNLSGTSVPEVVPNTLDLLARAVVPLMLLSLGLSLRYIPLQRAYCVLYALIILIQLR